MIGFHYGSQFYGIVNSEVDDGIGPVSLREYEQSMQLYDFET